MLKNLILCLYIAQLAVLTETDARIGDLKRQRSDRQKKRKLSPKNINHNKLKNKLAKVKKIAAREKGIPMVAITAETIDKEILQTAKDASLNGLSKKDIIALAVDVASQISTSEMSPAEFSLADKIGKDGLAAICQIIAWATANKNFSGNSFSTLINDDAQGKSEVEDTIRANQDILKDIFKDSLFISLMEEEDNANLILDMIAKAAVQIIKENSQERSFSEKIQNMFSSWGSGKWHLNSNISKYNAAINQMVSQHPVNASEQKVSLLAAHLVLFGIHTFRKEMKETLQSFLTSPLFKNIVVVLSASPDVTSSDPIAAEAQRLDAAYQQATKKSFDHIAKGLGVNIPFSELILAPNLRSTPWYLSPIGISLGLVGVAAFAQTAYLSYKVRAETLKKNKAPVLNKEEDIGDKGDKGDKDRVVPGIEHSNNNFKEEDENGEGDKGHIGQIIATGMLAGAGAARYRSNRHNGAAPPGSKPLTPAELEEAKALYRKITFQNPAEQKFYNGLNTEERKHYDALTDTQRAELMNFIAVYGVGGMPTSLYGIDQRILLRAFQIAKNAFK